MSHLKFVSQKLLRLLLSLVAPAILLVFVFCVYSFNSHPSAPRAPKYDTAHLKKEYELVVAAIKADNTSWVAEELPEWAHHVYIADDRWADEGVPKHKGREAMVYLTYIIDNYYSLPNLMVFLHGRRWQWHNDDPDWDTVATIKKLQIPYVKSVGYANLRCHWEPNACPASIHTNPSERPQLAAGQSKNDAEVFYADAWKEIFPREPLPKAVGQTCCAQFAVTKERVQRRKLEDYERIRRWLLKTKIRDSMSGRIMEYSWHILFGAPPLNCPVARDCYCNLYGICNLNCPDDGNCDDTWIWPDTSLEKVWGDGHS